MNELIIKFLMEQTGVTFAEILNSVSVERFHTKESVIYRNDSRGFLLKQSTAKYVLCLKLSRQHKDRGAIVIIVNQLDQIPKIMELASFVVKEISAQ